jgi:hypothetical protein
MLAESNETPKIRDTCSRSFDPMRTDIRMAEAIDIVVRAI